MTSTRDAELAGIGWQSARDFAKIDIEGWSQPPCWEPQGWLASDPDGLILEANGLSRRCPVSWAAAVDVLRNHNMDFTWPDFDAYSLPIFEDPPPVSPFLDYLVLSRDARSVCNEGRTSVPRPAWVKQLARWLTQPESAA
jgi:hypothetical protein